MKAVTFPLRAQRERSKEFYGDLASLKFWEMFSTSSIQTNFLQTAEGIICHQPNPAVKMTTLTANGVFFIEPTVDGDVLSYVNSQTNTRTKIHDFAGLAVIAMKVIDFDRSKLLILTDNLELYENTDSLSIVPSSEVPRRKG